MEGGGLPQRPSRWNEGGASFMVCRIFGGFLIMARITDLSFHFLPRECSMIAASYNHEVL